MPLHINVNVAIIKEHAELFTVSPLRLTVLHGGSPRGIPYKQSVQSGFGARLLAKSGIVFNTIEASKRLRR
jgi:hypothetical protein